MDKYFMADREAGNIIDEFDSIEEAKKAILAYEEEDRKDGTYSEDFYDVVDIDRRSVL